MLPPPSFQYVSELMLHDSMEPPVLPTLAPNLILAGNIGKPHSTVYRKFLHTCSSRHAHVFVVFGPYEYYKDYNTSYTMEETEKNFQDWLKNSSLLQNVIFLNNSCFHFPESDTRIFGTTLWTSINPKQHDMVNMLVGDYKYIPKFTTAIARTKHADALQHLANFTSQSSKTTPSIIVTYHRPTCHKQQEKNRDISSAFETQLQLDTTTCVHVVYGHSYVPLKTVTNNTNTRYYTNPDPANLTSWFSTSLM